MPTSPYHSNVVDYPNNREPDARTRETPDKPIDIRQAIADREATEHFSAWSVPNPGLWSNRR